jgi:hypothetical protein
LAPESRTATGFRAEGKSVTIEPRVHAEDHHRGHHLRAGAAGGDEGIRLPIGLQSQPDGHGAVRLAPHHGAGLVRHLDDVGGFDDRDAIALGRMRRQLALEEGAQLRLHQRGAADELDTVSGIELGEREERAGYGRLGREVAPHGVQRDPRQGQASLAATRCSPA